MSDYRPRWRGLVAGLLVVGLLAVMFATSRSRDRLTFVERVVRDGMAPIETALAVVTHRVRAMGDQWRTLRTLQEENRRLREQLASLQMRNEALEEAWRENQRLRSMLGLVDDDRWHTVTARVIGRPVSNWWSQVTINRGARHGVEPSTAVVTGEGAVGRVLSVTERTAEVLLLVDPQSAVGALVRRTSEPVVVEGVAAGPAALRLRALVTEPDMRPGDVVVTSRLSRLFPPGLPIGRIVEIVPAAPGRAMEAWVEPIVDFARLEVVAVLSAERAAEDASEARAEDDTSAESADPQ